MTEQALKRIEEKHGWDGARIARPRACGGCRVSNPCNVVRLARALARLLEAVEVKGNVPPATRSECRRTLEEVAGGGDE